MLQIYSVLTLLLLTLTGCSFSTESEVRVPPLWDVTTTEKQVILALGDSLTAGLGVNPDENYPAQLEAKLTAEGYNYRVQNAWVSGDTSAQLLARLDWLLEGFTDTPPALAIVEIGANDSFQGISATTLDKNLREIIEKLKAKNIPILLTGMKAPYNLGILYRSDFEKVFARVAKDYDLPFMPFFLEDVAAEVKYNQNDGIHPTKEGYEIVVKNLFEYLKEFKLIQK